MKLTQRMCLLVGFVLALGAANPLYAQITINSTTTTAAISKTGQLVTLASVANIAAKDGLFIDREFMRVQSCDTVALTCLVTRGQQTTSNRVHASGSVVWTGPYQRFSLFDNVGSCAAPALTEEFLPHINISNGNIQQCSSGEWVMWRVGGYRDRDMGRSDGGTTYTVSGAITVQPGMVFLGSGGALAMTIVNPTTEQNGLIMVIKSSTAQAHTLTYTAGFDGRGAATDVATWTAAIGNHITIIASNGVWWILSISGVTPA